MQKMRSSENKHKLFLAQHWERSLEVEVTREGFLGEVTLKSELESSQRNLNG
jgi:hypothetical protein